MTALSRITEGQALVTLRLVPFCNQLIAIIALVVDDDVVALPTVAVIAIGEEFAADALDNLIVCHAVIGEHFSDYFIRGDVDKFNSHFYFLLCISVVDFFALSLRTL